MTRDRSAIYTALFLILGCICYRLWSGLHVGALPNISPVIAVALIGSMYLPRTWGGLVAPVAVIISGVAFVFVDRLTEGVMFSWMTLASLVFYTLVGLLGVMLARNKSLVKILSASVLCSVLFYLLANTFSWWANSTPTLPYSYSPTFAGWWQANTVGLAGWQPTWTFLRNGVIGDLVFAVILLAIFDRELLLHPLRSRQGAKVSAA